MGAEAARTWFRPKEAALYVGLSKAYLAKLRKEGGGPPFRKLGRVVSYARGDLDRWLERHPLVTSTSHGAGCEDLAAGAP